MQTSVTQIQAGKAGMLYANDSDTVNLPTIEVIGFGCAVVRDDATGGLKAGNADVFGVSVLNKGYAIDAAAGIPAKGVLGATVVRKGYIFVETAGGATLGGEVYANAAGQFSNAAADGFVQLTSGFEWFTPAAAGGVAVLRVNL